MRNTSTVEPLHLRACLSRFVTGVVVVTYRGEGEMRGLTVNSFTSVSLEPPLVLVSVARSARAAGHLGRVPFSVNVLGASQLDVALHFAGRPRDPVVVAWQSTGDDLAPTLAGALATFRCRPWQSYDGGDHRLHLGHVMEADAQDDGEPLLFDRGRFSDVGAGVGVGSADVRAA
jgi:flavin reductase